MLWESRLHRLCFRWLFQAQAQQEIYKILRICYFLAPLRSHALVVGSSWHYRRPFWSSSYLTSATRLTLSFTPCMLAATPLRVGWWHPWKKNRVRNQGISTSRVLLDWGHKAEIPPKCANSEPMGSSHSVSNVHSVSHKGGSLASSWSSLQD